MTSPTSPFASRRARNVKLLVTLAVLGHASMTSLYAVNAAWNTDAGTGNFGDANWTSGTTTPAAGGTYTVLSGDALYFGTSSTTLLSNTLSDATFNGLTFNSGASAYTIGGNSFTLNGDITNNSSSLQTISANLVLASGASRTLSAASGNLTVTGNITATIQNFTIAGGNTVTLAGTNVINTTGNNFRGLAMNGSNLVVTGSTTISGAGFTDYRGYMTLAGNANITVQAGGSLTVNTSNRADMNSIIGQNATGTSTITVNGGSFSLNGGGGFALGNNRSDATGVLTVNSGTATILAGSTTATDLRSFVAMGRDGATGTINLNGGTLETSRNFVRDGSSGTGVGDTGGVANFNFNGGTLKALANQNDWLNSTTINTHQQALSSVTTTSASSTIDANGFTVGINNNITGSGGFHIVDSSGTTGVVNFGGSNYSYTGTTSVDSGTLNTNAALVTLSGALVVNGGTLSLNGSGAGTLALGANDFTMTLGTISYSLGDQITGSGTFAISGGMLDLTNSISDYGVSYTFMSGFASGSVSGLSIMNYDSLNYVANLSDAGVLSFSAIPEPSTYAGLAGLAALGLVAYRRRRRA